MLWFELAWTALELILCTLRIEFSSGDDEELTLEALILVVFRSLFLEMVAGSYVPLSLSTRSIELISTMVEVAVTTGSWEDDALLVAF